MTANQRFHGFWGALCARIPALRSDGKVKVSAEVVRKLCEESYASGFEAGKSSKSLFEQVFGPDR